MSMTVNTQPAMNATPLRGPRLVASTRLKEIRLNGDTAAVSASRARVPSDELVMRPPLGHVRSGRVSHPAGDARRAAASDRRIRAAAAALGVGRLGRGGGTDRRVA